MIDEWLNVFGGWLRVGRIEMSAEAFDELVEMLDRQDEPKPRLERLFKEPSRFDQQ